VIGIAFLRITAVTKQEEKADSSVVRLETQRPPVMAVKADAGKPFVQNTYK